jgi:hypothetical protein
MTHRAPSPRQDSPAFSAVKWLLCTIRSIIAGAGRSRPPTASYSRAGQIKRLAILPVSWQPGGGEITPP